MNFNERYETLINVYTYLYRTLPNVTLPTVSEQRYSALPSVNTHHCCPSPDVPPRSSRRGGPSAGRGPAPGAAGGDGEGEPGRQAGPDGEQPPAERERP